MTYLEIVNNVLKRLRERTVSTVNENTYSALIGILVNDAKDEVENAWKWSGLRTTMTVTTTANTFAYTLTGAGGIFDTLDVLNDTDDFFLEYKTAHEMNKLFLGSGTTETGSPRYYSFNGVNSNGDTVVDLYPIPDATYTIRYNMVKRTDDFSADADVNSLPDHPIVMLAYAKAVEERGEDAGISASSAYMAAQKHLSDYIALDAAKHPEELQWYTA
jgi:hypothetical protein